jgi:hypothetical protein
MRTGSLFIVTFFPPGHMPFLTKMCGEELCGGICVDPTGLLGKNLFSGRRLCFLKKFPVGRDECGKGRKRWKAKEGGIRQKGHFYFCKRIHACDIKN